VRKRGREEQRKRGKRKKGAGKREKKRTREEDIFSNDRRSKIIIFLYDRKEN
jgi:hypothetical protein